MKKLLATATALFLLAGASTASAAEGIPSGGNAAVTQYEPTPPVTPPEYKTPPPPGQETEGEKRQKKPKNENEPRNEVESEKGSGGGNPGGSGNGPGSGSSPETTGPSTGSSGLPFTGFDLLAVFGVGALLLLAGLAQAGRLPKLGRQQS